MSRRLTAGPATGERPCRPIGPAHVPFPQQDVESIRASDEHEKLTLHDPGRPLPAGAKICLIPGHCDPTVNLNDWYVGYRGDRVETLWPITARGATL